MVERQSRGGQLLMGAGSGRLAVVLLLLSSFLVFSGTLGHELVWDDVPVIRYARSTVEEGGVRALVLAPFSTGVDGPDELSGYYRPLSLASMWINSPAGDPPPWSYHLVNLLLHVINSLLVYNMLLLVIPTGPGALLGGLIFAVHPVHSESVAFVSGRTDLLAALFILLTVILWYRSSRSGGAVPRNGFVLGMAAFALACLSKEIAFVLPAVILLWTAVLRETHPGSASAQAWARYKWILGSFLVLGALLFLRLAVLNIGTGPGWSRYAQLGEASLVSLLGDVAVNMLQYIRLMVFPWPLSVFYAPVRPELTWLTGASFLVFLSLCTAFAGRRHHRIGLVALMWTLLFLLPVSGIVGLGQSVIAERFCYLPSVGVVMVMGYTLGWLRDRVASKNLHTGLVLILIIVLGAGSVLHAARWKDDLTLFTNALYGGTVRVPTMYVSLGIAYKDRGDRERALEAFEEAVRLDPSFLRALLNLGVTQTEMGYPGKAVDTFERAAVLDPLNPAVWYNRGVALEELDRLEEALEAYDRTARLDPGETAAFYRKGQLLHRAGRYEESLAAYTKVVQIDPDHTGALIGMGRSHESMGRVEQAVGSYMKAIEVQPEEIIAYIDLGRILLATNRIPEAVEVYGMAAAMDPGDAAASKGLVLAHVKAGERGKARSYVDGLRSDDPALYGQLREFLESLPGP